MNSSNSDFNRHHLYEIEVLKSIATEKDENVPRYHSRETLTHKESPLIRVLADAAHDENNAGWSLESLLDLPRLPLIASVLVLKLSGSVQACRG
ncbi:MAG: hypothetical protein LC130_23455 [Bryobacterales bacterium]|nr:hypothetical protein [Bryobacterales bacterium]